MICNMIRDLIYELKQTFRDKYGKGKWVKVKDLKKDPELAKELFDLIQNAYKKIGGNLNIRSPYDLMKGDISLIQAIDIDSDPDADAVRLSKKSASGTKFVGSGHDDSDVAKGELTQKIASNLKKRGFYAELSGALAHIMLTRYGIHSVDDEKTVRKVLKGKEIEWVGPHPEGKYPQSAGWYYRIIGGERHLKIMLGLPLS